MDQYTLDPYEQQLLKVFNSHDRNHQGTLDKEGLVELCQTLQLEDQGGELVKCLIKDKSSRVTFMEFKEALLTLLGSMQNNKHTKNEEIITETEKDSPEREVSPKYVYGSKKYGRRSRPRNEDINSILKEKNETGLNKSANNASVQRSNSQSEVLSKKRKTNYKLKRCTSLPGNNELTINTDNNFISSHIFSSETEIVCTEAMLREAWKTLGVGEDGYLNQTELILVCDAIGLHKLADGVIRQLSDKLSRNFEHKISFQELLEVLQQDETWFEVLNHTSTVEEDPMFRISNENLFPDSRTFQFVTLGPDGNGSINTDVLIEMWEGVGIHSPKELLHELGFNSRKISIIQLAEVLDKQLKGVTEASRTEFQSPHIALLQASLSLYQSEIKCFTSILEQMQAEREKLKGDVVEANNRATMLAQEVDDNHSRMEQNTLNQVKLLEQRHSDIMKEVSEQFTKDKEQLSTLNRSLEEKIASLEQEAAKLRSDLLVAQKYSINVEKENHNLSVHVHDLEKDKNVLKTQIEMLESEKQNYNEIGQEENKLLLAKLSALQIENTQLKDKNDEMVSEIECLSNQVSSMRPNMSSTPTPNSNTLDRSMEENVAFICEGVGIGAKRRSDYSPTKDTNLFTDGSPRLGKIRKFQKNKNDHLEVPFTSSESGFDTEVECCDSSLSNSVNNDGEEIRRLQAKISFLEQILAQNSIPIPLNDLKETEEGGEEYLNKRVRKLEMVIFEVKSEMKAMIERDCVNCDNLRNISEKLENSIDSETFVVRVKSIDVSCQTDFVDCFEEKVKELEQENKELSLKCTELENCVDLLRNEYEKCEDYWQNKVDEERQLFEMEQKISSDKLNELVVKMHEYEDQYANSDLMDGRLATIDETENLEKQFTDLEQEFEDYKANTENELFKKEEEIALLKEKLTELAVRQRDSKETGVQVECDTEETRLLNKMQSLSSYVVENTSRYPDEMLPPSRTSTSDFPWSHQNTSESSDHCVEPNSLPINWNFNSNVQNAAPSSSVGIEKSSTPCRPKRTRKHDKNLYKRNNPEKEVKKTDRAISTQPQPDWKAVPRGGNEQMVYVPLASYHNLNGRRTYLEQRVRHLQVCLKQQHFCNEQALQHYWLQFRGERADLHAKLKYLQDKLDQQVRTCNEQLDKLERTDVLCKDLFIENSYLLANVQRLEHQCQMLTQCNAHSSSV